MDFSDKPIIIIGVGHSGTRLMVEMLQRLGSDGGDYDNEWKENKFFLGLHQTMIEKFSNIEWTKALLSPEFVSSFEDDGQSRLLNFLREAHNRTASGRHLALGNTPKC